MAHYLIQGGYAPGPGPASSRIPKTARRPFAPPWRAYGGADAMYYTFGADDFVVLGEVPGHVEAAAVSIAVASARRYQKFRTTPLLTAQGMVQAMPAASKVSLRPAGS